jgi:protein-S-isoprenylcysteine O-methyltransferase Ste14
MSTASKTTKPLYPPTYFLVAVLLMLGLHFLIPVKQVIRSPYRYLGLVPMAAGLVLNMWGSRLFDRTGTTIKPFETSSALVLHGPYRVSRNPMYLGMVVFLFGVWVLAGSITPFLVVVGFAYFIDRRFIRPEEAMLEQAFGSQYASYRARVRRWV